MGTKNALPHAVKTKGKKFIKLFSKKTGWVKNEWLYHSIN
jgi:hypothetical protein